MPNIGFFSTSACKVGYKYANAAGSPGPLLRKIPSGSCARISPGVAVAGMTITLQPAFSSSRKMLYLIP